MSSPDPENSDPLSELVEELGSCGIALSLHDSTPDEITIEAKGISFPGLKEVSGVTDEERDAAMKNMSKWKGLPAPTSIKEALSRPDAVLWRESLQSEIMTFVKLNVMSNGHTAKELDAQGVTAKPIPLKYVFKVKWDPSGNYLKHKARLCLVGCPRYCIAGVHYNKSDVYACCPDSSMIRLIMVIALLEGWGNTNFDIKSAYLQALAGEGTNIST
eukprot:COSAG05_NODE_327_length_11345_cov_16.236884_9_plen_215_part_01